MHWLSATVAVSLLPLPATAGAAGAAQRRPNIVILLADDWGFTDIGAFGGEIRTPNIDALAARGVRFSNFHVAGSCSPTRAMLQTGVGNHRAGVGNMLEIIPPDHLGKPGYDAELNDRVVTIADQLRNGGYRTYLTGKWHLGHTPSKLPTARGYDRAFALSQSGADNFEEKPNLLLYDRADWSEDGKPARLPKPYYSSRFIVDKMIDYIESGRASGKPFLASVNFLANHIPLQAPDADIAAYAGRYQAGWAALRNERLAGAISHGVMPAGMKMAPLPANLDWNSLTSDERAQRAGAMAVYGGMATAMDREIGRLVAHLKSKGDYDNTIFVFLSDNGAEAADPMHTNAFTRWNTTRSYDQSLGNQGRKGSMTAIGAGFANAASAPLRGTKFTASEGGIRVPLIISWPANPSISGGRVSDGFSHVTDVAPTLLALAGVPPQRGRFAGRVVEPMIGRNLMPLLTGAENPVPVHSEPVGYELAGNAVLFKGDYKLVRNLPPYGNGRWQLYNLKTDPGETLDLAGMEQDRFTAMQADYAAYAKDNQVLPMPEGYNALQQAQANAVRKLLIPRLLALWPFAATIIAALAGLVWWHRRKRMGMA